MNKDLVALGSQTARNGFANEADVVSAFNNRQSDVIARERLIVMGYDISKIEYIHAVQLKKGYKTDVQVQVKIIIKLQDAIDLQNISVKLVSNDVGFNQIDKRAMKSYIELWNIPDDIVVILEHFCGIRVPYTTSRNPKRMFFDEFTQDEQTRLMCFLESNKLLIVNDILRGRGEFCAERMLVIIKTDIYKRVLKPMNEVINFFGGGEIKKSPQGSILIGKITMQRKGGDGGRESAKMLQFKIDPTKLLQTK